MFDIGMTLKKTLAYLKNTLSNKEKYAFEKNMMKDPFEEEALEGLGNLSAKQLEADFEKLQFRLKNKTRKNNRKIIFLRTRIAASILLFIGLGTLVYVLNIEQPNLNEIQQTKPVVVSPKEEIKEFDPSQLNNLDVEIDALVISEEEEEQIETKRIPPTTTRSLKKKAISRPSPKTEFKQEIEISHEVEEVVISDVKKVNAIINTSPDTQIEKLADHDLPQNKLIKGTVTDSEGQPLPGVTITDSKKKTRAVTDFDGNFSLESDKNSTLEFNYIGFEKLIKQANDSMSIAMQEDNASLDEVVVVGYGTLKKSKITKAAENAKNEAKLLNEIENKIAGISLKPSENQKLKGITNTKTPLYIIDGIEMKNGFPTIDPYEIAMMDVLKKAEEITAYGTKGANGVVLVTTKRGLLHSAIFSENRNTQQSVFYKTTIADFKNWLQTNIDRSLFKENKKYAIKIKFSVQTNGQLSNFKIFNYKKLKIKKALKELLAKSPLWTAATKVDGTLIPLEIELVLEPTFN
ncbi:carboxypeptidase-like regulatory domain-containing protein [Flavicella sediminum]|uniref:carboxypeptidase-like regulatory domain-containing protein n=1 Tax=Flavicella sediminum TaxID=2585141 RepID=UPI00111EAB2A|nr:carboxypeptidase-like regulatory domain-containing protein [Flavicella sediminum]